MKKTAIVTGASSGIGAATAEQLLKDGWTVFACARLKERMVSLESKGAITLELDVMQDESMRAMVEAVMLHSTRIDALINNAGYGSYGALEDVSMEEGRYQFEINVFGLARLTQLVLPHMRAQGSGKIVNITSIGGKIYEPLGSWYHASKFAVEGLSDCLRMEVKPFGLTSSSLSPEPSKPSGAVLPKRRFWRSPAPLPIKSRRDTEPECWLMQTGAHQIQS